MTDLHTKAMLAQTYARLALYCLDRPEDKALRDRVKKAEQELREAISPACAPMSG